MNFSNLKRVQSENIFTLTYLKSILESTVILTIWANANSLNIWFIFAVYVHKINELLA